MIIGIPKEIKENEYRVSMTPENVHALSTRGHLVLIGSQAGNAIGFSDEDYRQAGASICFNAKDIFTRAEMIVKVKEPQATERAWLHEEQILFSYLHLAPDLNQTSDLIKSKAICIAYETISSPNNQLPLLSPMSDVAGRMSIQAGAWALSQHNGGAGILLSGVAGVAPAHVVILGGGTVGKNAAKMAIGLGANVTLIDKKIETLQKLDDIFQGRANVIYASKTNIEQTVLTADLVIGAVLIPGDNAPKLISRELVSRMKKGAVLVDVAIDQGGCFETSRPTTHENPTYIIDGIVHYCVANMPGAYAKTATLALNNASLPYILRLAEHGYKKALLEDPYFMAGLNVYRGQVTNKEVAKSNQFTYVDPYTLL